jgi:glyoxylate/hydroxypyruvate/2-ketogluconate reductase
MATSDAGHPKVFLPISRLPDGCADNVALHTYRDFIVKQKILLTRAIFPVVTERLKEYFDVELNLDDVEYSPEELRRRLLDKDGVLTTIGDRIDAQILCGAPRLKAACNMAVGFNNFDMAAFGERRVMATNTPDVLNETTADFGWAMMMAAARRIPEAERWLRQGAWTKWSYDAMLGSDIHGACLGIIGMGRIGQALARRASGFNMHVLYNNLEPVGNEAQLGMTYVTRDVLLSRADHVILTLPYTSETHHTIGATELSKMKPSATLVNLSRGGIVDDIALADALKSGKIGAAALDVFEGEPTVYPGLLDAPNAVLTPHIASASVATRLKMANLAADNLIAALGHGPQAGRPPCLLNPHVFATAHQGR